MKRLSSTIAALLIAMMLCVLSAYAQLSGPLSGVITAGTYTIIGDISVEEGDSLTIEPGVVFEFDGDYDFDIDGYLYAEGSEEDSIKFISSIEDSTWGGIYFSNTANDSGRLEYCLITGSNSTGLFIFHCSPVINNCSFIDNSTIWSGGGINCDNSNAVISNCYFSNNSASVNGGGVHFDHSSNSIIINCIIIGNFSNGGGGIKCYDNSSPTIDNCIIIENVVIGYGGGIRCDNYCNPYIVNCTVTDNSALYGGGIECSDDSNPTISRCNISGNDGNYGGGIFCESSSSTIENCTISGNQATDEGGGVYCCDESSPAGVNNIIWANSASIGSQIYIEVGCSFTCTYSDIQDGWEGEGNIDDDPLFYSTVGDSAYYLTIESPCIDAGDPDSPFDPDSTRADMGAYYFDQSSGVGSIPNNPFPTVYAFYPSYPNPFNPSTVLSYQLTADSYVELKVYDVMGREVQLAVSSWQLAGYYEVMFDGNGLASGVYFARLSAGGLQQVQKLVLVK